METETIVIPKFLLGKELSWLRKISWWAVDFEDRGDKDQETINWAEQGHGQRGREEREGEERDT